MPVCLNYGAQIYQESVEKLTIEIFGNLLEESLLTYIELVTIMVTRRAADKKCESQVDFQ